MKRHRTDRRNFIERQNSAIFLDENPTAPIGSDGLKPEAPSALRLRPAVALVTRCDVRHGDVTCHPGEPPHWQLLGLAEFPLFYIMFTICRVRNSMSTCFASHELSACPYHTADSYVSFGDALKILIHMQFRHSPVHFFPLTSPHYSIFSVLVHTDHGGVRSKYRFVLHCLLHVTTHKIFTFTFQGLS